MAFADSAVPGTERRRIDLPVPRPRSHPGTRSDGPDWTWTRAAERRNLNPWDPPGLDLDDQALEFGRQCLEEPTPLGPTLLERSLRHRDPVHFPAASTALKTAQSALLHATHSLRSPSLDHDVTSLYRRLREDVTSPFGQRILSANASFRPTHRDLLTSRALGYRVSNDSKQKPRTSRRDASVSTTSLLNT